MNAEQTINETLEKLDMSRLGEAISLLKNLYYGKASLIGHEEFLAIAHDYDLMCEYHLRGFVDPQRETLYKSLLQRLYRVIADLDISWRCKNKTTYVNAFRSADRLNMAHGFLRSVLENFVSEVALLSLEPETVRQTKMEEIYARHQTFVDRLFNSILVSCQWSNSDADFYAELLTSPTIDANDQQVIVSAITLSAMNVYDLNKLRVLVDVYTKASEEGVRQRSLVGWVLALGDHPMFGDEQSALIEGFFHQEEVLHELVSLQMQFFHCMDAERDNDKIQRDIMPNLVQNSGLDISRFGISEKEDDPMESIMHPDADEQKMEIMEENIQKMMKMQEQGSDIYFGGFRQMKRFPFFNDLSNWFAPFFVQHPGLMEVTRKLGDTQFLELLLEKGHFCESDKYSLALAMSSVISKLPANMLEVLKSGDTIGFGDNKEVSDKPTYLRRMYLQDLYRFFRINQQQRNDLSDPFTESMNSKSFFFVNEAFNPFLIEKQMMSVALFLNKYKHYDHLHSLLACFDSENVNFKILKAYDAVRNDDLTTAYDCFDCVLDKEPYNEWALKGMAGLNMQTKAFSEAIEHYEKLMELQPEKKFYAINYSLCLMFSDRNKEALNKLYELNLNHPDDKSILRVLAWVLLCDKNAVKAQAIYGQLLADGPVSEDYLNAAYAQWISRNIAEARDYFRKWQELEPQKDIMIEFFNDNSMLIANGITPTDQQLMLGLVNDRRNSGEELLS